MGMLDKFLDVMRLTAEDDYEEDYEDYEDDDYEDEPPKKRRSFRSSKDDEDEFEDKRARSTKMNSKVTPIRSRKQSTNNMEVCVIKPTSVEDAREITETLLMERTVVLNVEGLDVDIAQRIIDFTSGSCFAINGNLQKVSSYIFLVTPPNVDISGDFASIIDAFDIPPMRAEY